MSKQKAWTKYEAALLLEGYIRVVEGKCSKKACVEDLSSKLRAMAVLQGEEIDDIYRNVNGISFQLSSMESAYQGHTVMKPASSLFTEMVHLYRTDPKVYSELLSEAMSMTHEIKMPNRQDFLSWFEEKEGSALLAQYQQIFSEIDKYCNRTKSINAGLFDPLSQERILQIQRVMENDKWYRIFHKKQLEEIRTALEFALQYLREIEAENTKIVSYNATPVVVDSVSTSEEKKGNDELPRETEPRPESSSENKPEIKEKQKTYFKDEKEDFYLWLGKDNDLSEKDRKRIVSAIRICEMFLQDNISPQYALFSKDVRLVRKSIDILLSDSNFKTKNEERQGKYYSALQKLGEYNDQRDPNYIPIAVIHEKAADNEQAVAPEVAENLACETSRPASADTEDAVIAKEDISVSASNIESAQKGRESLSSNPSSDDSGSELSLSEQIEAVLRKECEKNPYGTTVSFIKGQVPGSTKAKILNILSSAIWAKYETGAWKYTGIDTASAIRVEAKVPSKELSVSAAHGKDEDLSPKKLESTDEATEAILRIDFENLPHLAFSKPLKLAYFGKELIGPCAWRELYVRLVEALYVDFPRRFVPGLSFVSASSIQIDFGNQKMSSKMRSPQKLSIEGQSMFLETNLSADSIALRIKKLLDRCDVDYEDVEIIYAAASSERTKKADDRASTTQTERKEKRPDKGEAQIAEEAKTKFVRNAKDQAIMKADPDAFRSVYYALKEKVRTNPEGCTATDVFLALNGKYKRKQIIEILQTASWAKKVNEYSFLFYDEQREEKKQQQSEEKAQSIEQEFFAWLPTAVPPGRIIELKRNVPAVDAVLQQRKFLPQPLFLTTKLCNVEAAEIQARRKLPSQKQRDMASELLRAYAAFLREKKKTSGEPKENREVTPEEGWIRFDFSNAESFFGTVPVYCSVDGQIIEEKNWARILVAIANMEIAKNNPALQSLYKHALIPNRNDRPFFLKKAIPGQNCVQLTNGYWINVNFVIPRLMEQIQALCLHCGYNKRQVVFYGLPREMRTAKERASERKSMPLEATPLPPEAPLYSEILCEKFVRGFRIGSGLDMKKFKRYYEEKTGGAAEKTDAQIEAIITRCGIRYDEKVFAPAAMLPGELREDLFSYIRSSLNSGKTALYYEAIFKEFSERFLDHYIYSADMLKSYIAYYNNGEFYLDSKYLSKEKAVEVNPFDDVKEYLLAAGVPVESDQICRDLSHIPQKTVLFILGSNAEFVNNGVLAANGSNSYFFIDVVELTDEDIDNIAVLIQNGIEEREFLSGNELIEAIRARYPHILESNAQISPLGMRDAIKYRLKDRFSFTGNVISRRDQAISMADVFAKYAKDHSEFTISELTTLAEEMKAGVYFDDVYAHALRIDAKRFVSKDQVHFQVAETDAAIENACSADYFPLRAIQTFSFFPDAGYPWNTVLLESYGYSFSQKYQLLHAGFNRTSSVGALVKRSSGIDSFDALLARALADSTEKLDKEAALDFFVKQGYLARRIYSGIEAVLLDAKAIRNKKGME